MTWDEQIAGAAEALFPPPEFGDGERSPLGLIRLEQLRESNRVAFRAGATRQRLLLRTDDATERVARVLHDRMYDVLAEATYPSGGTPPPHVIDEVRRRRWANAKAVARATLDAVLGEES